MSDARIEVLGTPRIVVDDRVLEVGSAQQQALLVMLGTAARHRVSLETIVDRLWSDDIPDTARKSVQVLVGRIRSMLGDPGAVRFHDGHYELDAGVRVDTSEFALDLDHAAAFARRGWWREAREHAEHALELWRGPALGTCADELWAMPIAAELEDRRIDAIELSLEASVQLGDHDHVVGRLDEVVAVHPHRARLQANRIIALARSGLQARALDACRTAIAAFDGDEREQLQQLQRRLLAQDRDVVGISKRARFDLPRPPRSATSLVGREAELAQVAESIRSGARIVTVVGAGGTGKSRLVAEVMRDRSRHFDDIAWIDLAETTDAGAVPAMVQRQLGIVGGDAEPAETIAAAFGGRRVLACFDNYEHVLDAAMLVTQLAELTDRAVFVQTSREPLRIDGEHLFELTPLVHDDDALALFRARAEAAGGQVAEDDAAVTLELCDLVDRLPLGIELAAARTSLLTPSQLLDRLRERFDLLRTRDASVPARQRSLIDVVEWSIELLDTADRHMLGVLSLFVGGATVDAAAAVADISIDDARASIDRLVEKSLVVDGTDRLDQRRVTLLETVRQVARASATMSDVDRFAEHACQIVAPANAPAVVRHRDRERIRVEASNVLAAIDACMHRDPERAAGIFGGLADHFQTSGTLADGERYARGVLDVIGSATSEAVDRARYTALCVLPLRGGAADLRDDMYRAIPRIDVRDPELGLLYRCAIAEAFRHVGDPSSALDVLASADMSGAIAESAAAARVAFVRGCCLADLGKLYESEEAFTWLSRTLVERGDEYWAFNAEVCRLINSDGGAMAAEQLPRLDEITDWMTDHGCRAYAAYVRMMAARMLYEHELLDECLERAAESLDELAWAGDMPMLTYGFGLFSLAAWEEGRSTDAGTYAVRALDHASRSGFTWCVEYALFVIAELARGAGDDGVFSMAVDAIDFDALDLRFRPDRIVAGVIPDRSRSAPDPARTPEAYASQLSNLADLWRRSSEGTTMVS